MTDYEIEQLRAEIARLKAVEMAKTDALHEARYNLWRAENEWRDAVHAVAMAQIRLNHEVNR